MDRTRSWTDPRDEKLWMLIRGLGTEVVFLRGGERCTALRDDQADLSSCTDEELEVLLDHSQRVRGTGA